VAREKGGSSKRTSGRARAAPGSARPERRTKGKGKAVTRRCRAGPSPPAPAATGKTLRDARGKAARTRVPPKSVVPQPPVPIAVGDLGAVPGEARNLIARYEPRGGGLTRGGPAIEGLVCSIREIVTGRLVARTKGPLAGYVIEVIHDLTFSPQFSSAANTQRGAAGALQPTPLAGAGGGRAPAGEERDLRERAGMWFRLRALLRKMAEGGEFVSVAGGGLASGEFRQLLDGWRVVKVKAELLIRQG